jgi:AcrR family transcriptional regulator
MARGKVTRQDWTMAALRALARGGVAAVAVEPLAAELGISRGSFYWHFTDRDALLESALALWEQRATEDVLGALAAIADPRERLRALLAEAFGGGTIDGLEPALLAHSDHPAVAPVLARVTHRRLEALGDLYAAIGLDPGAARRSAVVAYATYLGWYELRRSASGEVPEVAATGADSAGALAHLIDQLVPGRNGPTPPGHPSTDQV